MLNDKNVKWYTKLANVTRFTTIRLILGVLAVAGVSHLIAEVDPVIKWPLAIILVGLLIKETIAEKL